MTRVMLLRALKDFTLDATRDLLLPVRRRVAEISYDRNMAVPHTEIITARLGNDAGIIGAALLGR